MTYVNMNVTEFGAVDGYLLIRFTAVFVKWCQWTQPSFKSVMFTS